MCIQKIKKNAVHSDPMQCRLLIGYWSIYALEITYQMTMECTIGRVHFYEKDDITTHCYTANGQFFYNHYVNVKNILENYGLE